MATDLLRPDLKLLFCGYNPSLRSGATGCHYAHPGNRFWRVLHAAGITERLYKPEEDEALLDRGIGFTNLCPRPTRRADELTREEILAGSDALEATLERLRLHGHRGLQVVPRDVEGRVGRAAGARNGGRGERGRSISVRAQPDGLRRARGALPGSRPLCPVKMDFRPSGGGSGRGGRAGGR